MSNKQQELKHLRSIGHDLKPVVIIGDKGLNENVQNELERALDDHELIKIKLALPDREDRQQVLDEICRIHKAELIQSIGKVALLLRHAKKPKPKLSNLLRQLP